MSTAARMSLPPAPVSEFDLDAPWMLHPSVSVRPEPFGALLYHFGNRRLSFLKTRQLLDVVCGLAVTPDARTACLEAGVAASQLPVMARALAALAAGDTIRRRPAANEESASGGELASNPESATVEEPA